MGLKAANPQDKFLFDSYKEVENKGFILSTLDEVDVTGLFLWMCMCQAVHQRPKLCCMDYYSYNEKSR